MQEKQYCVYIMTNHHNNVLYTGVTNDLQRRVLEHKSGKGSTFTSKYQINKLVYFECGEDIHAAVYREKQIKAGSRQKKIDLVNSMNPEWKDLYEEYFGQ
jgi:putative endonuclease